MKRSLPTITDDAKLAGRRVLVRIAADVPLVGNRVTDDSRLREALPTVVRLLRANAKVILLGHLGRPKGRVQSALSLKPVAERLRQLLPSDVGDVTFVSSWNHPTVETAVRRLRNRNILFLENLRFLKGEEANDKGLAKWLATLGDVYVNECISNSHRAHASIAGVPKYIPHYIGWEFAKELNALQDVAAKPTQPFVLLIGGVKVEDKVPMLVQLAAEAKAILVGGAVANTCLRLRGVGIGKSAFLSRPPRALKSVLLKRVRYAGVRGALLQVPLDVVVAKRSNGPYRLVRFARGETVAPTETIFDIGPETTRLYATFIKKAETILWNGPLGMVEVPPFDQGTKAIARLVAGRSRGLAYGVVGGGDTVGLFDQLGIRGDLDYCSTAGGAMLTYLANKPLPGLVALGVK
ncbi:MAG: phosphoglycerate kinase [Patescibacteria group bacterium]|jgi:phosphoglycerate kinase